MHFLSTTKFFHRKKIVSHNINGENMVSIRRSKQVKGGSHENKFKQEESLYIALTETKQIDVANGNVTFFLTSSTWAPGFTSHCGTIMMWLRELPLRMPLWEPCRIFGMTIMSMYTPSTSYVAQILATCFYGDVRVGPSDRHFWMLLKYSSTEV